MKHRNPEIWRNRILLPLATFMIGWFAGSSACRGWEWSSTCPHKTGTTQEPVVKNWLAPLEHSPEPTDFVFTFRRRPLSSTTDTFTPFHRYMMELGTPYHHQKNFTELPLFHTWIHFFEAYHNHMARFRNQEKVVFMEIGVQSGGKIPLLRKYFGPGLTYVGLDINPSTKKFETKENDDFTVHIEIGDSQNVTFLREIKKKYPHVDIFLDDGGHTMQQQITAIKHMLPHVQPEGIYMCEDLATSWLKDFGGLENGFVAGNPFFARRTMVGFIHQTLDWLMASSVGTSDKFREKKHLDELPDNLFDAPGNRGNWWRTIPSQVKHIHYYNQIVVYEKGVTYRPREWKTGGSQLPFTDSGEHAKVDWGLIIQKLDDIFGKELL